MADFLAAECLDHDYETAWLTRLDPERHLAVQNNAVMFTVSLHRICFSNHAVHEKSRFELRYSYHFHDVNAKAHHHSTGDCLFMLWMT